MKFINYYRNNKQKGFTIIEMIIAISVFSLVVTVGMASLLNAYKVHRKTNSMRSVMDNLNFIVDDMSRTIRVGYDYSCDENVAHVDCSTTKGYTLSLKDQYAQTVVYKIGNFVTKKVNNSTLFLSDTSISIDLAKSGFKIIGADPTNDNIQPLVIIMLSGKITTTQGDVTPFSIQTSVSQRTLDIPGAIVVTGGNSGSGTTLPVGAYFIANENTSFNIPSAGGTLYYAASGIYYGNPVAAVGGQSFYCTAISFATSSVSNAGCYFLSSAPSGTALPVGAYQIADDNTSFNVPSLGGIVYYASEGMYYGNSVSTAGDRTFSCEARTFNTNPISGAKCYFLLNSSDGSRLPKGAYFVAKDYTSFKSPSDGMVYYSSNDYYFGNPVSTYADSQFDCDSGIFGTDPILGAACYFLAGRSGSPDYVTSLPFDAIECSKMCEYKENVTLYYGNSSDFYYTLNVTGPGSTECIYSNFNLSSEIKDASCYMSSTGTTGGSSDYTSGIPSNASFCVYQDGICEYDFSNMESGGIAYYGNSSSDYFLQINSTGNFPCLAEFFNGGIIDGAWCAVAPNGPGCYIAYDTSGTKSDPICN